ATIDPAVSAPLRACGICLRGVAFVDGNRANRLVIKLLDNLAGTPVADGLCLRAPRALGGVVERLTDIAERTREGVGHLPGRLVAEITHLPLCLAQHAVRAALQPFVAAGTRYLARLGQLQPGELLVAVLDRRLRHASANANDPLPIGRGKQG